MVKNIFNKLLLYNDYQLLKRATTTTKNGFSSFNGGNAQQLKYQLKILLPTLGIVLLMLIWLWTDNNPAGCAPPCLNSFSMYSQKFFGAKSISSNNAVDVKRWSQWLGSAGLEEKVPPEFEQFIFNGVCNGRLGNQLSRFASMFAIGQHLNRTPVYQSGETKPREFDAELAATFPNFHKRIYFMKKWNESEVEKVDWIHGWSDYRNPEELVPYNEKRKKFMYLQGDPVLMNANYFDHIRNKILWLYEFHPDLIAKVMPRIEQIFGRDTAHKLCVHIRAGDLSGFGSSDTAQIGPATDRMMKWLNSMKKEATDGEALAFSLVLFGEEKELARKAEANGIKTKLNRVYHMVDAEMTRDEELCFAAHGCDSFLHSAPLSSFGFWMGYLMPDNRPKFFIRKHFGGIDAMRLMPQSWFPIEEQWLQLL